MGILYYHNIASHLMRQSCFFSPITQYSENNRRQHLLLAIIVLCTLNILPHLIFTTLLGRYNERDSDIKDLAQVHTTYLKISLPLS